MPPGQPPENPEPYDGQPPPQSPPPPPPPPPLPPAYGNPQFAQGYGYPAARRTSGKATAILVLGIVGLVLMCGYGIGVIPAIVALSLAPGAKREIAASGGQLDGESFIKAGVICSWIAVGLTLASIVFILILVAVSVGAG